MAITKRAQDEMHQCVRDALDSCAAELVERDRVGMLPDGVIMAIWRRTDLSYGNGTLKIVTDFVKDECVRRVAGITP